jgi:broad specificity phosphatase PhoE
MTSLYLIRHGQAGPRQRYDELSTLGREQARRLGDHFALRRVRFDAVVSGTLNRQRHRGRLSPTSCALPGHFA